MITVLLKLRLKFRIYEMIVTFNVILFAIFICRMSYMVISMLVSQWYSKLLYQSLTRIILPSILTLHKTVSVLYSLRLSLIFPFHLLASPAYPTRFYFYIFGFLAFFNLSLNNNKHLNWIASCCRLFTSYYVIVTRVEFSL